MTRLFKPVLAAAIGTAALLTASTGTAGERLVVEKNHTARIALSSPAASVIVGNPEIADVNIVDSRTVYILGKGFGNSSVTITDRNGRAIFDAEIAVTAVHSGAITVYKGLKPSLMICSNVCVSEDVNSGNTSPANAPGVSAPIIGAAVTQ